MYMSIVKPIYVQKSGQKGANYLSYGKFPKIVNSIINKHAKHIYMHY